MDVLCLEVTKKKKSASRSVGLKLTKKRKIRKRLRESDVVAPRDPLPIKDHDTDLCISIWQSVILQAIYDLVGENDRESKAAAMAWFGQLGDGINPTDFELVCELAELEPGKVRQSAKQAQRYGASILDGFNFRSLRKENSSRKGRK